MADLPADGTPWPAANVAIDAWLHGTYEALDAWCRADAALLWFQPGPGCWSGREILEHVHLTNHYLLVLADKIAERVERRAARGEAWPLHPARVRDLDVILDGAWPHPEHMSPTGQTGAAEVGAGLRKDLGRCAALLARFPEGEGTLHTIRFSVVERRLDLAGVLVFAGFHARRHLAQLARNRAAYEKS